MIAKPCCLVHGEQYEMPSKLLQEKQYYSTVVEARHRKQGISVVFYHSLTRGLRQPTSPLSTWDYSCGEHDKCPDNLTGLTGAGKR